jgi:AraC-like DNA-binding protein
MTTSVTRDDGARRQAAAETSVNTEREAPVADLLVRRALRLFEQAPERRWTVEELDQELGTSRPVLGRRFAEALGKAPLSALREVRMNLAAQRLATTDEALIAIADAVGYDSEFAFSRAFLRHFGVRPGRYRQAHLSPTAQHSPTLMLAA